MAEEYYKIPKDPQYRAAAIRKLQDSDPASATLVFNPLIEAMLESLAHVQAHKAALGEDGKVDASQLPEMDASNFTYDGQPLDEFLDEVKESVSVDRGIPRTPYQFGGLTYNGEVQKPVWNGFDPAAMLISGIQEAADAGTYEAIFSPKQGYYWTDNGGNESRSSFWTIGRVEVEVPSQSNSPVYNGESHSPTWEGYQPDIMTLAGDTSGIGAGEYGAIFILDNNYQWPDGTVGSRDVTWAIGRATIASVPSQSGSLTYTGEEQTPAFTGYSAAQMAIAGAQTGTNAGTYKVQFTPDENHQWPDGSTGAKEVSWAIAPAAGSITLDKSSLELRASLMSGVITVTRPGDGAITATSGNTSIATVSVDGNEVTVTAKAKGSVNITIAVGAGTNHTAPASQTVSVTVTLPTAVLNDNSWATIQDVAASGNAANYWSVGDTKNITINGKVGNFTFANLAIQTYIIGFDHNSAREGTKTIHFLIGKIDGKEVALCDNQFGNEQTAAGYFHMNSSRTNSGGWDSCYMNKTLLNGASNSLLKALPSELQAVIQPVTKYTDNTGGGSNTASYVTGKPCKLFLLAEFEVQGTRSYANSAEQNYQQQYAYFKAGNPKIANRHTAVTSAVWWWLRSPYYHGNGTFCYVYGGGSPNGSYASWSAGVRPGFCVSAAA
ncbi:DUF6273 domain-containing protein [Oscillospiraceae bacterium 21-37]